MTAPTATLWQRFRRWWRPPRTLKITTMGRTYLLVTVGVGLGALNTGNNLLYLVLGFLLSLIVVSGVLSERCLRFLRVRRVLPDGVHATEAFALRYEIQRQKGQAFALELSEADGTLPGQAWVAWVDQTEPKVVRADSKAERRGPLKLTGIRVTTTFPLGLFAKTRVLDVEDTLIVFPRRGFLCEEPPEHEGQRMGDGGNPRRRDGTGDLLGLRELQPNEDARRVHWLKSAAAGKLLKVEREREERRQYLLDVDATLPPQKLEQKCEETAALVDRLIQRGHEVGLNTGAMRLRPAAGIGQERRLLHALAWVGFEDERPEAEKTPS